MENDISPIMNCTPTRHVFEAASVRCVCRQREWDALPPAAKFERELEALINRHSQENASNTPDFILARLLVTCLAAFNEASRARETWYGQALAIDAPSPDSTMRELIGWLSGDIPELHHVEVPRLAASLDRFLVARVAARTAVVPSASGGGDEAQAF